MSLDLNQYREAHRPWSFTHRGRTYLARHVSAPNVLRYTQQLRTISADRDAALERANDPRAIDRIYRRAERRLEWLLRWLLRLAFPWGPLYWLTGDPVKLIMDLDPVARGKALTDFFGSLGLTIGATTAPSKTTHGTHLRERIPRRRA